LYFGSQPHRPSQSAAMLQPAVDAGPMLPDGDSGDGRAGGCGQVAPTDADAAAGALAPTASPSASTRAAAAAGEARPRQPADAEARAQAQAREVPLLGGSSSSRIGPEVHQPRRRHWCVRALQDALCGSCERSLVFLERAMLVVGAELPDPLPAVAARQVRRLRCPGLLGVLFYCIGLTIQIWCVARGWELILQGVPSECQPLYGWLLGYCAGLTLLPFCCAVAGPLVAFWAAMGILVRSHMLESCERVAPGIFTFVDEVLYSSLATCGFVAVAWFFIWIVRYRGRRLQRIFGTTGPTEQSVVNRILAEGAAVELGAECCICLEGDSPSQIEEGRRESWRKLRCGHHFHERCLVEWLRRARRCPLCRMDLHACYLLGVNLQEEDLMAM